MVKYYQSDVTWGVGVKQRFEYFLLSDSEMKTLHVNNFVNPEFYPYSIRQHPLIDTYKKYENKSVVTNGLASASTYNDTNLDGFIDYDMNFDGKVSVGNQTYANKIYKGYSGVTIDNNSIPKIYNYLIKNNYSPADVKARFESSLKGNLS